MKRIYSSILALLLGVIPNICFAEIAIGTVTPANCPIGGLLSCDTDLAGRIANIFVSSTVTGGAIGKAFIGVLFAMLVFYGFRLIIYSKTESSEVEGITAYVQGLIGTAIVAGASILANAVTGQTITGGVINPDLIVSDGIDKIILFIRLAVAALLTLNLLIQGFRFIVSLSEGNFDSARKNIIQSMAGTALVMIASPIINAISPGSLDTAITEEVVGIANFLATIFGTLAVLGFIVGGVMLVMSFDEALRDRGRTLIISSLIAMIVVVSSYALVQLLL